MSRSRCWVVLRRSSSAVAAAAIAACAALPAAGHCGCDAESGQTINTPMNLPTAANVLSGFEPLPDKVAVLAISSHPDDEGIFFGGALPYYSQARNLPTTLISMTSGDFNLANGPIREQELKNAAMVYGVQHEPLFPRFRDYWFGTGPDSTDKTFDIWNDGVPNNGDAAQGRVKSAVYIATQIRALRPEVVIGHDVEGEYGHGNHRAAAFATADAWDLAANPSIVLVDDQGQPLAPWTPSKLYLHLYDDQPGSLSDLFHTGWETPYDVLNGLTPRQVTNLGLAQHASQNNGNYRVSTWYPPGADGESFDGEDAERWGLFATSVGIDPESAGFAGQFYYGDFLHNVDLGDFAVFLADTDRDGDVDDTDLGVAISSFSGPGAAGLQQTDGDTDGDGDVDDTDLGVAISAFTGPLAPAVPEPGSAAACIAAAIALLRRRGR